MPSSERPCPLDCRSGGPQIRASTGPFFRAGVRGLASALLLAAVVGFAPASARGQAEDGEEKVEEQKVEEDQLAGVAVGVPMRSRDFTFPSFLVLGFSPTPAQPLGKGNYALELLYSQVNNFQVSPAVEEYLAETRGDGPRRALGPEDVEAILALPEGDAFYIDNELTFYEFTVYYGVTDHFDIGLGWYYVGYSGGELDGSIFDFHDQFGFGQQGRQYVPDDNFQVIFGSDELEPVVLLDRPGSGGSSDPFFYFRYSFPKRGKKWQFAVAGGIKAPVASEEEFLSTGSWDFGVQLIADRRWQRSALIVDLGYVVPGRFRVNDFDPPNLPSARISFLRQLRRWENVRIMLQGLTAEHPFRDLVDSDLTELEVQLTLALKWNTRAGVFGVGLTENLFNMDNTPDIALHFSWGWLGIRR
ncbi:MAG: DUF3187 family protein [Holophagales bacterium]|nr:DUF3187 family protein [Holophagales bacterium]